MFIQFSLLISGSRNVTLYSNMKLWPRFSLTVILKSNISMKKIRKLVMVLLAMSNWKQKIIKLKMSAK
jgi:hypothetical protein